MQYTTPYISLFVTSSFAQLLHEQSGAGRLSAAAPDCIDPLQLLLPIASIHFNCCSLFVSASAAAPQLHLLVASAVLESSSPCPHAQCSRPFFAELRFSAVKKYESHTSLVQSHPTNIPLHMSHNLNVLMHVLSLLGGVVY